MRTLAERTSASTISVLAILAVAATLLPAPAAAQEPWADAATASITPGAQTVTGGAQCTANFAFTATTQTPSGPQREVYLGQAAHCAGTGAATDTNGCTAGSLELDTPVEVEGATRPGTLAYSSWLTMQAVGESDPNTCAYNDFALIRLDPADHDMVNPSVPFWGGPTALGAATQAGEQVFSYGNSSLRLGLSLLSPKTGQSLGTSGDGWTHTVYTATPGIPGDSGSAFLDSSGRAVGVLSTLALAPLTGSNGVSDLALALDYLETHTSLGVELAAGTEPFTPLP